jgi:hypothetical protein
MTNPKYNPNKNGNANVTHHNPNYYDEKGTYLMYGSGCTLGGKSCFDCKLPDCMWDNNNLVVKNMAGGERCTT